MNRREFLAAASGVPAALGAADLQCRVLDARGEPVAVQDLSRLYICDLKLRPFVFQPRISPGEVSFAPVREPCRIGFPMPVPGFGHVYLYADNGGAGFTPADFSQPLFLNLRFAADRLAAARRAVERCQPSPGTLRRLDAAAALLQKAEGAADNTRAAAGFAMESLAESLWAGEEAVLERARQAIARRGTRSGFLFGANAFGYTRHGQPYAERFEGLFNFATLGFYPGSIERTFAQPDYSRLEKTLGWLDKTRIMTKGHTLIYLKPQGLATWLQGKSVEETKKLCASYIKRTIAAFRNRVHTWDIINEAHYQYGIESTAEDQVEFTRAAAIAAREADPTCCRIVNSCCTWSEYMRRPRPCQASVYDYVRNTIAAGVDFEVIGLQYYHNSRDLLEIERSIETFEHLGKPIHITELAVSSSSEAIPNQWNEKPRPPWHGDQWTEKLQADWMEQFYTVCYSKPQIHAITMWDLNDPAFIPHGGLLREDLTPKESYHRLSALLKGWRDMQP